MKARNHTPEDYKTFCEWWEQWGWPAVPESFIPPQSIVVEQDGKPICAVFIYKTDTPIIWAENYISDRNSHLRGKALDFLIAEMLSTFKNCVIMSSVKNRSLAKRLETGGFIKCDENLTNYVIKV